ncbi:uncharacterized protein SPSK_06151 [Sporothrix schenckii 1099-18]|uniref:Uncharacterized protein n=1 Tax=Sporothrix schenckii 1099-18 TaxID=1397361 RepID=A0A0F2MHK4_SPOSC|nr:uncharacterized protein SPSK_06151 [Sporothrix schenckii 1099-18]KJR89107.1 hypothetical protein SPSK_06151 [Sporothrix schenckii 1099-18]
MVIFVDLDDEDVEPPHHLQHGKLLWSSTAAVLDRAHGQQVRTPPSSPPIRPQTQNKTKSEGPSIQDDANAHDNVEEAHKPDVAEIPNWNSMTEALGCYPISATIASFIDQNTLDSLARTCRQIRAGLIQFRKPLLASTLRCHNENLPVDSEETLRYRARAGNWFYMEDQARTSYDTKAGECARDMVGGCRRCGTIVCRNCAIKPPAPIVLRDRHRRLCDGCVKAPLTTLAKPPLPASTPLESDAMQLAICCCASEGVWLCQPCGRSIRGADYDYRAIWKWRTQYGEVLGGLGTGIGEGDRGVICGRDQDCCCAKEREQETDCDAEDAREAEDSPNGSLAGSASPLASPAVSPSAVMNESPWAVPIAPATQAAATVGSPLYSPEVAAAVTNRRTPSPALGPGYARHEIEGIGGVVKRKRVKMVRVGACVHDWEDELARGAILEREITGSVRSWCGWCWRPIPSQRDADNHGSDDHVDLQAHY